MLLAASEQPTLFERIAVLGAADMVLTAGLHHEDMQKPLVDGLRSAEEPTDNPMAMVIRTMISDAGSDREAVAGFLASPHRFVTAEGLSAIKAATLVVVGGADMAGPSDLVLQTIPNATG